MLLLSPATGMFAQRSVEFEISCAPSTCLYNPLTHFAISKLNTLAGSSSFFQTRPFSLSHSPSAHSGGHTGAWVATRGRSWPVIISFLRRCGKTQCDSRVLIALWCTSETTAHTGVQTRIDGLEQLYLQREDSIFSFFWDQSAHRAQSHIKQ